MEISECNKGNDNRRSRLWDYYTLIRGHDISFRGVGIIVVICYRYSTTLKRVMAVSPCPFAYIFPMLYLFLIEFARKYARFYALVCTVVHAGVRAIVLPKFSPYLCNVNDS